MGAGAAAQGCRGSAPFTRAVTLREASRDARLRGVRCVRGGEDRGV